MLIGQVDEFRPVASIPAIPSIPTIPSIPAVPSIPAIPKFPTIPSVASIASKTSTVSSLGSHSTLEVPSINATEQVPVPIAQLLETISQTSQYFIDYPLSLSGFGELGKRLQVLGGWIQSRDALLNQTTSEQSTALLENIEKTSLSLFPFLKDPLRPANRHVFSDMRNRQRPGFRGLVIPAGKGSFRFACHLVNNIRQVLHSTLPIQIAYAGDSDLPSQYRDFICSQGVDIETLNVLEVVDDEVLQLAKDGWAIKPFAVLTSAFDQVMLLDADAVLLQAPEAILDHHSGYRKTGTLLFHDRLLWQGAFKERHKWWEQELEHHTPSPALAKSLVYNHGYAEECDSGMVVMDKSRLQTFLGLLHICWQNTLEVRRALTYKMGYGDKESWWFGLELSGADYTFENHYGAVLGEVREVEEKQKVCGFTIAHTSEDDKLLWYNGSLLKNKAINDTLFDLPSHWMMDAIWEKGATKPDMSCMRDGQPRAVSRAELEILQASVGGAKRIDERLKASNLM